MRVIICDIKDDRKLAEVELPAIPAVGEKVTLYYPTLDCTGIVRERYWYLRADPFVVLMVDVSEDHD